MRECHNLRIAPAIRDSRFVLQRLDLTATYANILAPPIGNYQRMRESHELSRRERQIMDSVYRRGKATAAEVMADLPDPPSYSAVRTMLRLLEDKDVLRHEQDGPRYVYIPVVARETARASALKHLLTTFFNGSAEQAMAALLELSDADLSTGQSDRMQQLIEQARTEGR